jgi:hypothetical protein
MSATPALDKMLRVQGRSQAIGEFLEWLGDQGITLAARHTHEPADEDDEDDLEEVEITHEGQEQGCYRAVPRIHRAGLYWERACGFNAAQLHPVSRSIEQLLADHFGVDLDAAEREKRAILDDLRSNTQRAG